MIAINLKTITNDIIASVETTLSRTGSIYLKNLMTYTVDNAPLFLTYLAREKMASLRVVKITILPSFSEVAVVVAVAVASRSNPTFFSCVDMLVILPPAIYCPVMTATLSRSIPPICARTCKCNAVYTQAHSYVIF